MSGTESKQHFQAVVDAGVKHTLVSFLYLQKAGFDLVEKRKKAHPQIRFFVDSGAHTFITDHVKYKQWSLAQWDKYLRDYTTWLRANKKWIECAVELDIDDIVGESVVKGWQEKYFKPLVAEGFKIIFVWHEPRGLQGWEQMVSDFAYVGLQGHLSARPDFNNFITTARRYSTCIHAFAGTKHSDFRDWPWYSIDSISWKNGEIYGMTIHWDESSSVPDLVYDQDKSHRHLYKKFYDQYGLDGAGIVAQKPGAYKDLTRYCLISFRRMEQYYERKYAARPAYYDVRLPHPRSLKNASLAEIKALWASLNPAEKFKQHAAETDYGALRDYVMAVGAVQNKDRELIEKGPRLWKFLEAYFPALLAQGTLVQDMSVFQRDMAAHITPAIRGGLQRVDASHYVPTNSPPKKREDKEFELVDLEHDMGDSPMSF